MVAANFFAGFGDAASGSRRLTARLGTGQQPSAPRSDFSSSSAPRDVGAGRRRAEAGRSVCSPRARGAWQLRLVLVLIGVAGGSESTCPGPPPDGTECATSAADGRQSLEDANYNISGWCTCYDACIAGLFSCCQLETGSRCIGSDVSMTSSGSASNQATAIPPHAVWTFTSGASCAANDCKPLNEVGCETAQRIHDGASYRGEQNLGDRPPACYLWANNKYLFFNERNTNRVTGSGETDADCSAQYPCICRCDAPPAPPAPAAPPGAATRINFRPISPRRGTATMPTDWRSDVGDAYGDRGGGLTYGWQCASASSGL